MAFGTLGHDPLEKLIDETLRRLSAGEPPSQIETERVDIKEEPHRRDHNGSILLGSATNEQAAQYLAREMACMANSPRGGALMVGIADDGTRIGTELNAEWLRHRIWELTAKKLTTSVRQENLAGCRILILSCAEAFDPIDYRGELRWRVGANCVEIDPIAWRSRMLDRIGFDWSDQPSGHTVEDISPVACEIARRYLQEGNEDGTGAELATASDTDLVQRLSLMKDQQRLTNAGSLLFVETPWSGLDYIRRDVPGGDSTVRIESTGPLIAQVHQIEQAAEAANRVSHLAKGFTHRRIRAIPPKTLREAIVNGVVHRDWLSPLPTTVEHVGDTLTVASPGGFLGGITPANIITHPAVPRYKGLAEAMSKLGLAEREGIGVDRMVRDMLAIGRPPPAIAEIDGPYVRVVLLGGAPDTNIVDLVADLSFAGVATVDSLLLIEHLSRHGWVDADSAIPVLQRSLPESEEAIVRLGDANLEFGPVITPIRGIPTHHPSAYRLSDEVRTLLAHRLTGLDSPEGREALILRWSRTRGRISTTEAADLTGHSKTSAGKLLTALADSGQLVGSRANRSGRGFHYLPANPGVDGTVA